MKSSAQRYGPQVVVTHHIGEDTKAGGQLHLGSVVVATIS